MRLHCPSLLGGVRIICRRRLVAACWRHPLCRRLLLLLTLALTLAVALPDAPLSRLMLSEDAERERLLQENEQRLQHSKQFLEKYRANGHSLPTGGGRNRSLPAHIGVTVLTMARGRRMGKNKASYRTEYLTQSVARLMELTNDISLRRSYSLHICNIDDHPESFTESKSLEDLLPVFHRYKVATNATQAPTDIWEKLKLDYVYCLQQTVAQGVQYVLLVEDDAIAHKQLFRVLEHVLDGVVEAPEARPVAYIKLYHPRRLLGYISLEVERLTELLALSVSLGAVLTFLFHHSLCNSCRNSDMSHRQTLKAWAGWGLSVGVLALAVGRTNLLELRRLSPQLYQVTPVPSCCIPAVLYTRQGAEDFGRFLLSVTCTKMHSTDIRMDEFREGQRARGLLVQPNLFSHIGLVSTLRKKEVSPLIVQ